MPFRQGLEHREAARQAILNLHKELLDKRLAEGYDMTTAIKLASEDLQDAIEKAPISGS